MSNLLDTFNIMRSFSNQSGNANPTSCQKFSTRQFAFSTSSSLYLF